MAYDEDTAIVLWPEYFDSRMTRSQGRRLPLSLCVPEPDLDIIAKGAAILDLEYRVHEDMAYPSNRIERRGCVKVERGPMPKTKILAAVGRTLVDNS
ncbi:MAG: hypothetical protein GX224_01905 [Thermoplasmatales archaeon]|nr:hypothetical protein [Thermoplasmatales archaeon]